jgi:TonB family protein
MASPTAELIRPATRAVVHRELRLLVELPPRHRVFFSNLRDTLLRRDVPRGILRYPRAAFWPDVFVERRVPWGRMRQSVLGHIFFVVAIYGLTTAWLTDQSLHPRVQLHRITTYDISEYLPPLDTGSEPAPKPRKGQPRLAKQKIISLQPNADNREQTIITPPNVKLPTNLPLPNIVAWTATPSVPTALANRQLSDIRLPNHTSIIAPAPDPIQRDLSQMRISPDTNVIAPPPEAKALQPTQKLNVEANVIAPPPSLDLAKLQQRRMNAPTPSVIEPPPDSNISRNLGQMNVGHLSATVAEPKLEVLEQQVRFIPGPSASGRRRAAAGGSESMAPPMNPVTAGGSGGQDAGQLIALNLNPVIPTGPINVPPGRRSGEFSAGPQGRPDAPGTPEIKGGGAGAGGSGSGVSGPGKGTSKDLPSGIVIGDAPGAPPPGSAVVAGAPKSNKEETVLASARPPHVGEIPRDRRSSSLPDGPKIEERVFGTRRIYTLSLNMPNLVSAGGSWIIRFAEISDDHSGKPLSAPVATAKVDPAYPADLIRNGVEGTVLLYAVIHKDGTVGEVRVLRGVQSRLDENARIAMSRWKFRPGTKNGEAVDLEAVVQIPFKVPQLRPY